MKGVNGLDYSVHKRLRHRDVAAAATLEYKRWWVICKYALWFGYSVDDLDRLVRQSSYTADDVWIYLVGADLCKMMASPKT